MTCSQAIRRIASALCFVLSSLLLFSGLLSQTTGCDPSNTIGVDRVDSFSRPELRISAGWKKLHRSERRAEQLYTCRLLLCLLFVRLVATRSTSISVARVFSQSGVRPLEGTQLAGLIVWHMFTDHFLNLISKRVIFCCTWPRFRVTSRLSPVTPEGFAGEVTAYSLRGMLCYLDPAAANSLPSVVNPSHGVFPQIQPHPNLITSPRSYAAEWEIEVGT